MQNDVIETNALFDSEPETIIVIGNGFDLDLGLKTSYSDFYASADWPFKGICPLSLRLGTYLNRQANGTWFDMELSMYQFAHRNLRSWMCRHGGSMWLNSVRCDDDLLVSSLCKYLSSAENGELDADSVAANVLRKCCGGLVPATIFSFNYTNLENIGRRLGVDCGLNVTHVHGTIKDQSVILGFNETRDIPDSLKFMCKSRRQKYKSTTLFNKLPQCKNVIFFGLSFGDIDYPYFKDFFDKLSVGKLEDKFIRIVTYDENSRQDILANIGRMTGKIFDICKHSNFKVIKTSDSSNFRDVEELYSLMEPKWMVDI